MSVTLVEALLRLRDEMTPALAKAGVALDRFGNQATSVGQSMLPLSVAFGLVAGASVKYAADFNAAMTESLAIVQMNEAQTKALGETARSVALTSTASAKQAAESFYFLASAGVSSAESLQKALPIVAMFSQAGVLPMAQATEFLTDSIKALGLSVDTDMTRIGDVITKAAVMSNASVSQLAEALTTKAATSMHTFNMQAEEGVAILSIYADQGIKGSIAGERFDILMRTLAKSAIENSAAMKEAGVAVFDASGEMNKMSDIIGSLEKRFVGMSSQQKIAQLAALGFRAESVAAITSLVGQSAQIVKYETNLKNAGGTMKSIADAQMKSFWNQLELVKKQFIDAAISLGNGFLPVLAKLGPFFSAAAAGAMAFASSFERMPLPAQAVLVGLTGLVIILPPLLVGLGMVAVGFGAVATAMAAPAFVGMGALLGPIAIGVAAVTAAIAIGVTYWDEITAVAAGFGEAAVGLGEILFSLANGAMRFLSLGLFDLNDVMAAAKAVVIAMGDSIRSITGGIVDFGAAFANAGMAADAAQIVWISIKNGLVNLAIAAEYARKAIAYVMGDKTAQAAAEADIKLLEQLKLSYSDAANEIVTKGSAVVDANKKSVASTAAHVTALQAAKDALAAEHGALAETAKQIKAREAAQKKATEAIMQGIKVENDWAKGAEKSAIEAEKASVAIARMQAAFMKTEGTSELERQVSLMVKLRAEQDLYVGQHGDKQWEDSHSMVPPSVSTGIKDAAKATMDWSKIVSTLHDSFETLGISTNSTAGKMLAAFGVAKALADETKKILNPTGSKTGGEAFKSLFTEATTGAQKAQVGMAALNVAMTAYSSGAKGGAIAGATFGAQFGPWGAAIGGAVGGILGFVGAAARARREAAALAAQIEKSRVAFIASAGGLARLEAQAKSAGLTLDRMFNAKTVTEYEAAIKQLQDTFDLQKKAQEDLTAAMDRYGITINDLGPKFKQQRLDEMAMALLKDYELLIAAGVDMKLVIEKMGPAFQEYVTKVVQGGATIPEALRPVIEYMIKMGLLLDENGDKITDIGKLNFAASLTDQVKDLVDAIYDMIAAMTGIPRKVNTEYSSTRTGPGPWNQPGGPGGENENPERAAAAGFSGWVNRPTRFLVGEAGPEYVQVTPKGKMSTTSDDSTGATPAPSSGGGEQIVHVNISMPGGEVIKFVERATRNRQIRIHPDSVRRF